MLLRSLICGYGIAKAVVRCSVKKVFLERFLKNTYFEEHLQAAAFESAFCSALPEISLIPPIDFSQKHLSQRKKLYFWEERLKLKYFLRNLHSEINLLNKIFVLLLK